MKETATVNLEEVKQALEDATVYGSDQWQYDIDAILAAARAYVDLMEGAVESVECLDCITAWPHKECRRIPVHLVPVSEETP